MKKVASPKSTKARGKQAAREDHDAVTATAAGVAGLPNGNAVDDLDDEDQQQHQQGRHQMEEHDRDATMASYRTANEPAEEGEEDDDDVTSEGSEGQDDTEEEGGDSSSQATSGAERRVQRIPQPTSHQSKRPRPVQEIFQQDAFSKVGRGKSMLF